MFWLDIGSWGYILSSSLFLRKNVPWGHTIELLHWLLSSLLWQNTQGKQRKMGRLIWIHSLKIQSIMLKKAWQQEHLIQSQDLDRDQKSILSPLLSVFICVYVHAHGNQKTTSDDISWEPSTLLRFLPFTMIHSLTVTGNLVSS